MVYDGFKKTLSAAKPYLERIAVDTAKGYAVGCVIGVFTPSNRPILQSMHRNGKTFAAMSATYTATEVAMEKLRKKNDPWNSVVAGAAAGAVGSQRGMFAGSTLFGAYSGLSTYFQNLSKGPNQL